MALHRVVVLALLLSSAFVEDKRAVPPLEVQAQVLQQLHLEWEAAYKKKSIRGKLALADEFAVLAAGEDDASVRYVLGVEELSLCLGASDVDRAIAVGRRIGAAFDGSDEASESEVHKILADGLAKLLGGGRHLERCRRIVALELGAAASVAERIALGTEWDAARDKAAASRRGWPAARARHHLLPVIWAPTPGAEAQSALALSLLERCEPDIEKADAKAKRFTLFQGRWLVSRADGSVLQYDIDLGGAMECLGEVRADGSQTVNSGDDAVSLLLRRRGQAVLGQHGAKGSAFRLRVRADELLVDYFQSGKKYPKAWGGTDRGLRDHLPQGAGLALACARLNLRLSNPGRVIQSLLDVDEAALRDQRVAREVADLRVRGYVLHFAEKSFNQQVGNGECWTLADAALRHGSAGRPKNGAGFGRLLGPGEDPSPGDIVQFEGARFEPTATSFFVMPHHTAIVSEVHGRQRVVLLHQNFGSSGKRVSRLPLDLGTLTAGTVDVYRPLANGK